MQIYDTSTFNSSVHVWLIFLHFHCLQAPYQHYGVLRKDFMIPTSKLFLVIMKQAMLV